jgi:cytosine permease
VAEEKGILSKMDEYCFDYETERVPETSLRSWWDILAVQFGFIFGSSALVWAMKFTAGFTFIDAIWVFVVGHFLVFWVFYLNGLLGVRERMTTFFIARQAFGPVGTHVIAVLLSFAMVGWMGAQVAATAEGIAAATGINVILLDIILGIGILWSSVVGFKALKRLSNVSVPFFIVVCIAGIVISHSKIGGIGALISAQPTQPMSFMQGISAVIGSIAMMGLVTPDISRYAKSSRDLSVAVIVSFAVGHILIPLAGVLMAMAAGSTNVGVVCWKLLGWWGVLMLILSGWTTADNDIYSAGLALQEVWPNVKRWKICTVVGILGTLAAIFGILKYLISWMVLLAAIAPPAFAIMQADYWVLPLFGVPRGLTEKQGRAINWVAFVCWIVGSFSFYYIKWGVPFINSTLITLVLYTLISIASYKSSHKVSMAN